MYSKPISLPIMIIGIVLVIIGFVLGDAPNQITNIILPRRIGVSTVISLYIGSLLVGGIMFLSGLIGILLNTVHKKEPKADIQEKIEQLHNLKQQGIISDEEFDEKKKELLSKL